MLLAATASAQTGVNILRYTPADTGTPGSLISVTFDRPVAGMLGRSFDARQVMSLEPAIDGTVGWRDPSTVRFVLAAPFAPGTSVVVSIDTAAAASAGVRRAPPRRIAGRETLKPQR